MGVPQPSDGSTYCLGTICRANSSAFEEEPNRIWGLALPLTESVHKLLQLGSTLDLEEHLIIVVGNFDV